ncbi:MAG: flagellar basal body P-ring formation protein FlgA [Phyllobacteriaceae bacterium]|nr:flagellar basal body P-ring formation protein FlgA [Phyllobacteriaceae bacterium]
MKYSAIQGRRPCLLPCDQDAGALLLRSLLGAAGLALLVTLLLSISGGTPAASAEPPRLRATVAVVGDTVTLGDFFEGAGALADRALFRAPDLGTTGPVAAARVVEMARAAGLAGAEANGVVEVSVTRLSRPVEATEIARLIAAETLRRPGHPDDVGIDDVVVTFDEPLVPQPADVRSTDPVRVVSLSSAPQTGRFEALVQIDQGERTDRIRLRGTIAETVQVTVLTRSVMRGDVIAAEDLRTERQPRNHLVAVHAPVDPADVVGRQARRSLRAGQPISASDFARPQVVARGDVVTVVYRTRALQVSGRGQAQQPGAVGDLVPVLNPQSKRTLHAVVVGPGLVEVASPSAGVATLAKAETR